MRVQAAVQQAAPATLIRAWPRLFAKQAGPGEQQGGAAAAADGGVNGEASSSGDEAEAAGAAADLDVAELQELLGKAQEEVRWVGSVAQRGPPVVCARGTALVQPRTVQSLCKQTRVWPYHPVKLLIAKCGAVLCCGVSAGSRLQGPLATQSC